MANAAVPTLVAAVVGTATGVPGSSLVRALWGPLMVGAAVSVAWLGGSPSHLPAGSIASSLAEARSFARSPEVLGAAPVAGPLAGLDLAVLWIEASTSFERFACEGSQRTSAAGVPAILSGCSAVDNERRPGGASGSSNWYTLHAVLQDLRSVLHFFQGALVCALLQFALGDTASTEGSIDVVTAAREWTIRSKGGMHSYMCLLW